MDAAKKETIKASLKETKARRGLQICKVYELKVDYSRLSKRTLCSLFRLFVEAKWLRNAIVGSDDIFSFDTKTKEVPVKVAGVFEQRPLALLGSQIKQGIHTQIKSELKSLSVKKKRGARVGRLKFKSYISSIPLKQYGYTYKLTPNGKLKIQNIKQQLRVRGMNQIPEGVEFANAKLLCKHGDFYLHLTCFMTQEQLAQHTKKKQRELPTREEAVGLDLGIKHQVTISNGLKVNYHVPVGSTIRKRHRAVSRKKKGSKNRFKARQRLQKAYAKTTNIKHDIVNKLVAILFLFSRVVCVQDDCIKGWQRIWGRRILETSVGGLIGKLKQLPDTIVVNRFFPSSQLCPVCHEKTPHTLEQRTFVCSACGYSADRDVNAAGNTLHEGLIGIGAVRSESLVADSTAVKSTPVDISTSRLMYEYLSGIPYVSVSRMAEAGSPIL